MPVAVATGRALHRMRLDAGPDPPLADSQVVMGGVRLTDPLEQEPLDASAIQQVSVDDLRRATPAVFAQLDRLSRTTDRIYVHIDMDVLDQREVEGHQTEVPNGPSSEELARLFEMICSGRLIASMDPHGRGQADMSQTLPESSSSLAVGAPPPPRRYARPIATALACVGAVVAFLIFTSEVFEAGVMDVDAAGRAWVVAHGSPFADRFFRVVTEMAATRVVLTVSLAGAVAVWLRGARRAAVPLALAAVLAPLTTRTIKPIFARLRPGYVDDGGRSFSFPSGHTTIATAVALTLAYVLVRERVAPRLAPVLALLFVVAVGASRVYLQEHWVTDTFGGVALGTAIAAACATVYEIARIGARRDEASRSEG